jgi:hypothetical protein
VKRLLATRACPSKLRKHVGPEYCEPVHIRRQSSRAINSQLRWGPQEQEQPPRELTALGAHDLSSKRSVIPFTMEEHHAFILRRMAARCDSAI